MVVDDDHASHPETRHLCTHGNTSVVINSCLARLLLLSRCLRRLQMLNSCVESLQLGSVIVFTRLKRFDSRRKNREPAVLPCHSPTTAMESTLESRRCSIATSPSRGSQQKSIPLTFTTVSSSMVFSGSLQSGVTFDSSKTLTPHRRNTSVQYGALRAPASRHPSLGAASFNASIASKLGTAGA